LGRTGAYARIGAVGSSNDGGTIAAISTIGEGLAFCCAEVASGTRAACTVILHSHFPTQGLVAERTDLQSGSRSGGELTQQQPNMLVPQVLPSHTQEVTTVPKAWQARQRRVRMGRRRRSTLVHTRYRII